MKRTGFWSSASMPGLPTKFPETAERLLFRFGDLKMSPKKIDDVCTWAMEDVDSDVFQR